MEINKIIFKHPNFQRSIAFDNQSSETDILNKVSNCLRTIQNEQSAYDKHHSFHSHVIWFAKGKYPTYTLKQVIAANAFMESKYVTHADVNEHVVSTVLAVLSPEHNETLFHFKDVLIKTATQESVEGMLSVLRNIAIKNIPFKLEDKLKEEDFRLENKRVTPENITKLKEGQIFVFGSNEAGVHGAFAAKLAKQKFGAIWGKAEGLQGKSYAIPTKDTQIITLNIREIEHYVDKFIEYASENPCYTFLVTAIGCGAAGYEPKDIAPLFKNAMSLENVWLPKSFWKVLNDY